MPRLPRLGLTGYPLHVIQRGNNRSICFRESGDYVLYLGLLNELAPLFGCDIHAYVLMPNHVHMLLTPQVPEGPSRLMQNIGQRYVPHFNRLHARSGTLWEGRFRASVIESEGYLFACQRYIELNPVRAGIVAHPWEYEWSSYRANAGRESSTFLVQNHQYLGLGMTEETRAKAYRDLFRDPIGDEVLHSIRFAINGGYALGSPDFINSIERLSARRASPGVPGRPRKGEFVS